MELPVHGMHKRMRFEKIAVESFPRSGTNYMTALLDLNFFDGKDYKKHRCGHKRGYHPKPGFGVVYMRRNFTDVSKSIFKIRNMFGLNEDVFESFLRRKLVDMFTTDLEVNIEVNYLCRKDVRTFVDPILGGWGGSLHSFHNNHIKSWMAKRSPSVMIVDYEDLISEFQGTMGKVAKFIGSGRSEFKNITEYVGFMPNSTDG